ncbi:hypothetical protein LBMAG25_06280 [Bacteroidota bacterium]|nr:hypothetical protein LBMAG25_06280 [Bacteroidota bacterium]
MHGLIYKIRKLIRNLLTYIQAGSVLLILYLNDANGQSDLKLYQQQGISTLISRVPIIKLESGVIINERHNIHLGYISNYNLGVSGLYHSNYKQLYSDVKYLGMSRRIVRTKYIDIGLGLDYLFTNYKAKIDTNAIHIRYQGFSIIPNVAFKLNEHVLLNVEVLNPYFLFRTKNINPYDPTRNVVYWFHSPFASIRFKF